MTARIVINTELGDKLAHRLVTAFSGGKTVPQAAETLGVSVRSFHKLCAVSAEFKRSYWLVRYKSEVITGGRPRLATKQLGDDLASGLPAMFAKGEHIAEVCAVLGFSRNTFAELRRQSPAFESAYQDGRTLAELFWNKLSRLLSLDKSKGNASVLMFTMANRFGWSHKAVIDVDNALPDAPVLDMSGLSTATLTELSELREQQPLSGITSYG